MEKNKAAIIFPLFFLKKEPMNVSFIICNILWNILKISNFEWHGFQNHVKTNKFSEIESFKLKDSNLFPIFGLAKQ